MFALHALVKSGDGYVIDLVWDKIIDCFYQRRQLLSKEQVTIELVFYYVAYVHARHFPNMVLFSYGGDTLIWSERLWNSHSTHILC